MKFCLRVIFVSSRRKLEFLESRISDSYILQKGESEISGSFFLSSHSILQRFGIENPHVTPQNIRMSGSVKFIHYKSV